jgi:hypothetical protein
MLYALNSCISFCFKKTKSTLFVTIVVIGPPIIPIPIPPLFPCEGGAVGGAVGDCARGFVDGGFDADDDGFDADDDGFDVFGEFDPSFTDDGDAGVDDVVAADTTDDADEDIVAAFDASCPFDSSFVDTDDAPDAAAAGVDTDTGDSGAFSSGTGIGDAAAASAIIIY